VPQTANNEEYTQVLLHKRNREAASSPASATIKTTVFQANTVVFLSQKFVAFRNPKRFDPNLTPVVNYAQNLKQE
jgi:hypothetical protein